jgi:hypothetical protein
MDKNFNNYLIGATGTTEADLKMKTQILNVHAVMQKYESFTKLKFNDQFDYCVTIIRIAVHTSMDDLSKLRKTGDTKIFELSIYKPTIIDCHNG